MKKICMSKNTAVEIEKVVNRIFEDFEEKLEDWQELYDERESNEPEYDSQIDRWQDALDRLQEKIDEAEDLKDRLESWIDELELPRSNGNAFVPVDGEVDVDEMLSILNDMKIFNAQHRGIAPIIKKFEKDVVIRIDRASISI